ncbi:MAG: glutamate 5-kinase [Candidatus Omnitrophica bacterium]|nr:glutamate 5-kinase [Candidatus Omnitrophota bacterium]
MPRKFPRPIKRVVIKVGSSVIATYRMKPRVARLRSLVEQICQARQKNIDVVLVSSGAIVFGMGAMNHMTRNANLATLQALAATGQTILMNKYLNFFKKHGSCCAQILLTWDDFDNRTRYNNARDTLNACFSNKIVPIVNENDTISTEEIKFGDNDRLSALVAGLIGADLLLLLSDVEGLYDIKDGTRYFFKEIKEITDEIESIASGTKKKHIAKGGMIAKLEAIKIATHANIPCIIANGETEDVLSRVLGGERIGTFFSEKKEKLLARKHWISFGVKPKGFIIIDQGAQAALLTGRRSLLLPGVVSWKGHFKQGDVVVVCDQVKHEIARGIVNYSIADLYQMKDKRGKLEAIHRDNLVLAQR